MTCERLTCFFFSGTGNTYRAAGWMVEAALDRGMEAALVPISLARPKDVEGGPDRLVGIYHPTHGLMPPWSMIKFLVRLPRGKGRPRVCGRHAGRHTGRPVADSRGGGPGPVFPRCWCCLSKVIACVADCGIDLPVNMTNIHWGIKPQNARRIMDLGQKTHQGLVDAVLAGGRYWRPFNLLWELVWSTPFWFWPILPIAYLVVGRVFMAKIMFADTSCTGCGICARNCPAGAIVMKGDRTTIVPFWTHRCEACMRCMAFCPVRGRAGRPPLDGAGFLRDFVSDRRNTPGFYHHGSGQACSAYRSGLEVARPWG